MISEDSYSLTMSLLNTTFNVHNASYGVEIDNGFVRYKDENVAIPGITQGNWIINTLPGKQYILTINND